MVAITMACLATFCVLQFGITPLWYIIWMAPFLVLLEYAAEDSGKTNALKTYDTFDYEFRLIEECEKQREATGDPNGVCTTRTVISAWTSNWVIDINNASSLCNSPLEFAAYCNQFPTNETNMNYITILTWNVPGYKGPRPSEFFPLTA
jgi:hypothetical protein